MDIKNLTYILEAYRCQSINKAAQNVFISQSHLSSIIKRMEEEIGYPIFVRTASGISVTSEGRFFLDNAEKIVKGWQNILHIPSHIRNLDTLTICCTPSSSIFQYFLDYKKAFPSSCNDTFLESGLNETIHAVVNQQCRMGILMMLEKQIQKYQMISEEYKLNFNILKHNIPMRIYMSCHHPLAGAQLITQEDLQQYPVITDINVEPDDLFTCTRMTRKALYISDRGTSYDAVCRDDYLLAGMMSPVNQAQLNCVSKPLKGGEPMTLCLIQSRLCTMTPREQEFLTYLNECLKHFGNE